MTPQSLHPCANPRNRPRRSRACLRRVQPEETWAPAGVHVASMSHYGHGRSNGMRSQWALADLSRSSHASAHWRSLSPSRSDPALCPGVRAFIPSYANLYRDLADFVEYTRASVGDGSAPVFLMGASSEGRGWG